MWSRKNAVLRLGIVSTLITAALMSPPIAHATLTDDTVTYPTLGSPTWAVLPTAMIGLSSDFTMFAVGITAKINGSYWY